MRKQTENTETYSVLMSVYNRENPAYLEQSIRSMMEQTLGCSDFVLVCDGPLNEGLEQVISWAKEELGERLQCVRLAENLGLGRALAAGLTCCRCAVVARMDSDDLSRPDRCEEQLKILRQGNYDIVSGSLQEFVETPGDIERFRVLPETPEEILKFAGNRNPFNHPCVMYRKDAVLKAGNYQDFPGFEDYYLWVRMLQQGCRGYNLQKVVLDMRTGNGMYARRGGKVYLLWVIRFQNFLRKEKFIGTGTFICNCAVRTVAAVVPKEWREKLYRSFLRKNRNESV